MSIPPTAFSRPQQDFKQMVQTTNVDAQDHYTEVHALFEQTQPVECLIESTAVQAVPTTRKRPTQCTVESSAQAQTQYEPQLFSEQKLTDIIQSKEFKSFFDKNTPSLKQALTTNHICDAEFALQLDEEEYDARGQSTLQEIQNLQNQVYSKDKPVTALAYSQYLKLTLIFQAVAPPGFVNQKDKVEDDKLGKYYVLIWNVADNTQPLAFLVAPAAVVSIDVSEYKGHLIIACGTITGQVLIFDLDGVYKHFYDGSQFVYNAKNTTVFQKSLERLGLPPAEFYPSIVTSPLHFHSMPVTDVKFLPQNSQITRSGELQTSASQFGTIQLVSVSPDGYIKLYSLMCFDKDPTRSDLMVLIPFMVIPSAIIFPHVKQIKPLTIQFVNSDVPSSLFIIGDIFGNICHSTWAAAVAGMYALEDEKKKLEKQFIREMNEQTKTNIERLETFSVDKPTKGTLINGFQYFLGGVFHLEFSQAMPNLLMAASSDGVKMWLVERKIHRQTLQYAIRGLVEEQFIFQQNMNSGLEAGFQIVQNLPLNERTYQTKSNAAVESGLIDAQAKQSAYKALVTPPAQFVDMPALFQNLNLSLLNIQHSNQQQQEITIQDLSKRAANMNQAVAYQFEHDYPNYDFHRPVFNFLLKDEQLSAACMSLSVPSVVFLGTDKGIVLVFDLNDRMYEPLIRVVVCQGQAISKMKYIRQAAMQTSGGAVIQQQTEGAYQILPEKKRIKTKDVLIVGDVSGNVHVFEIPRLLRHRRDAPALRNKFRKCLEAGEYIQYRQALRKQSRLEAEAAK
ncbi:Conserved_hypothetical protein [Hexamita inflata]|uniref:Uncharacterized protein n=2 Tax=Hexamita inflata TaxID=28002 RepID=A0AA86RJH4_9EUKA|nr:Conserved hypothetical protein [Hexamita inflata]